MSHEPPLLPALVCQNCGATNRPDAKSCWLCEDRDNPYASASQLEPAVPAGSSAQTNGQSEPWSPTQTRIETVFMAVLIAITVLAVLIAIGIGVNEPGLLVPYLIVILPGFLAATVRGLVSAAKRQRPKPSQMFLTFIWSTLFTVATLIVLIAAAIIALFISCMAFCSNLGGGPH